MLLADINIDDAKNYFIRKMPGVPLGELFDLVGHYSLDYEVIGIAYNRCIQKEQELGILSEEEVADILNDQACEWDV